MCEDVTAMFEHLLVLPYLHVEKVDTDLYASYNLA